MWQGVGVTQLAPIITLTPAPAVDRTYIFDTLLPGEVHRASEVRAELAGKGVNVSRGLALAGVPSFAVVPLSQADVSSLEDELIHPHLVDTALRVNITLLEAGGRTTKVNERPSALSADDWSAMIEKALNLSSLNHGSWILLAGTIPPNKQGGPLNLLPLFHEAKELGIAVGLDTSGAPLFELARAGLPDVIKPNAPELAECVGRSLQTLGDVIDAAQEVHDWGVAHVLVSLGADGMVGVSNTDVFHAHTEPVTVTNTIGAGDASVAGFLSHISHRPSEFGEAISRAVSWGALKVQEQSSQLQSLDGLVPAILTDNPDRSKKLREPGLF